jgi:hypothetical protein
MGEYMEKSNAWKAVQGNDDYLQATMETMGGGRNEADWRRYLSAQGYKGRALEQGVAAIRSAKRDTSDEVFESAAVVANASTTTGWKEGGAGQMMASINEVAGGDREMAQNMLAQMRQRTAQARRTDLGGAGFGTQSRALEAMYGGDASGHKITIAEATDLMNTEALDKQGPGALIGASGDAIKQLAPQMVKRLTNAHANVNNATTPEARAAAERELKQEYASIAGRYDVMSQGSPENAKIMADTVLGAGIVLGDGSGSTVRQVIERYRSSQDPDFLEMRRELGMLERDGAAKAQAVMSGQDPGAGIGGMPTLR